MKKVFKKYYGYQLLTAILLSVLLPFLSQQMGWHRIHRVIWLYLVINGIYTLYLGYAIRKNGYTPLLILLTPVLFAGVSSVWLNIVPMQYGIYFSLLYLVLSLFTFFGDTRDDPDEKLIPIENGYHSLPSGSKEELLLPIDGGFKS